MSITVNKNLGTKKNRVSVVNCYTVTTLVIYELIMRQAFTDARQWQPFLFMKYFINLQVRPPKRSGTQKLFYAHPIIKCTLKTNQFNFLLLAKLK